MADKQKSSGGENNRQKLGKKVESRATATNKAKGVQKVPRSAANDISSEINVANAKDKEQSLTNDNKKQNKKNQTSKNDPVSKEKIMNYQPFEIPNFFNEVNEQMTQQSKKAFEAWKLNAEQGLAALQTAFGEASKGFVNLQLETVGVLQKQLEANMSLLQELLGTTNPSDFMEKANAFTQKNVEDAMQNTKNFQEKFTAIANDAASPIKEVVEKASKVA